MFTAVHVYGARLCSRVLGEIGGTVHEQHVRELMASLRQDMVVVSLIQVWWPGRRQRDSMFGYHPWNATVWLAVHANRYTLPDALVADAVLLRNLRSVELGLMLAFVAVWALNILSHFT